MRRLIAIFAFLAGGIAAEMAQPVQYVLVHARVHASRAQIKRRRQ